MSSLPIFEATRFRPTVNSLGCMLEKAVVGYRSANLIFLQSGSAIEDAANAIRFVVLPLVIF